MKRTPASLVVCLAALAASTFAHAQTGTDARARQRLQQLQLEDQLRLNTQQALPPRSTLSPSDARRLDELQLRQRMEQQRLDAEQAAILRERARDPASAKLEIQQRLLDQERQLQLQRFQIEQQELLRSAKPPPLQRPRGGALQQ